MIPRTKKTTQAKRSGEPVKENVIARNKVTKQSCGRSRLLRCARNDEGKGPATTALNAKSATTTAKKDGLPAQAFAIVPDPNDPAGWQLPHHTLPMVKDIEASVDWPLTEKATLLLSLPGDEGRRVSADPALIIEAARHIARHYRNAGKPVPTALCVLI